MLGLYHSYLGQGDRQTEVAVVFFPESNTHLVISEQVDLEPHYVFTLTDATHEVKTPTVSIVYNPHFGITNATHQMVASEPSLIVTTNFSVNPSTHQLRSQRVTISLESRVFTGVQWVRKI